MRDFRLCIILCGALLFMVFLKFMVVYLQQ